VSIFFRAPHTPMADDTPMTPMTPMSENRHQEATSTTSHQHVLSTDTAGSVDNADAASDATGESSGGRNSHDSAGTSSKKNDKARLKQEKKDQKAAEKARKKEEKDAKKTGRLHMDGMIDKAIRMLYPITREGRKTINASIKDEIISSALIRKAKGLAFLTIAKTSFFVGMQGGLGIIIGRKPDGGWSPPCAFGTGGVSAGIMLGVSVVDLLLIINTEEQLKILSSKGMVKLGADLEVTIGPLGRNAQAAVAAGTKGVAGVYAYSFSKGIYGGISLDGCAIWPYDAENERFYGQKVSTQDLFAGHVEVTHPRARDLLDRFNETLVTMGERTHRRSRTTSSGNLTGDDASPSTTDDNSEDPVPDAVLNYLKERGDDA